MALFCTILFLYYANIQPVGITDRLRCEANYYFFLESECNKMNIHVLKSDDAFCHTKEVLTLKTKKTKKLEELKY